MRICASYSDICIGTCGTVLVGIRRVPAPSDGVVAEASSARELIGGHNEAWTEIQRNNS